MKLVKAPVDLKTYNTILRRNIKSAKRDYYNSRFEKYKGDIKSTWFTIKEILSRKPVKKIPDYLNIDGTREYDKVTITNTFNIYFASIWNKLASGNRTYTDFLQTPIAQTFTFNPINEETAIIIIIIIIIIKCMCSRCRRDDIHVYFAYASPQRMPHMYDHKTVNLKYIIWIENN